MRTDSWRREAEGDPTMKTISISMMLALLVAAGCTKDDKSDTEQKPEATGASKVTAETPATNTPAEPTLEKVVADHFEALGGADKWLAAKTFSYTIADAKGDGNSFTIQRKRPNLMRAEGVDEGEKVLKIFDGDKGLYVHGKERKVVTGDKAKGMAAHAAFDDALLTYQKTGLKVELAGTEKVDGKPAHVVVLHHDWGTETRYIDQATNYEVKRVIEMEHEGDKKTNVHYFTDYKEVDGVMVNHGLISEKDGERHEMVVKEISLNKELDDSLFAIEGDS
jgi:hypothetical protein